MNNEMHTPEPWIAVCDNTRKKGNFHAPMALVVTPAPSSKSTAIDCTGSGVTFAESCANARRIVACVNACARISTRMLEEIGTGGVDKGEMWKRAEKQRDELAEALRKAEDLRPLLVKELDYVPEGVLAFCNQARDALAKLK